jgi:hypothetical protein
MKIPRLSIGCDQSQPVITVPVAMELSPTGDHGAEPLEAPLMNIIRN